MLKTPKERIDEIVHHLEALRDKYNFPYILDIKGRLLAFALIEGIVNKVIANDDTRLEWSIQQALTDFLEIDTWRKEAELVGQLSYIIKKGEELINKEDDHYVTVFESWEG